MRVETSFYLIWSFFLFIFACLQFFQAFFPITFSNDGDDNNIRNRQDLHKLPHFDRSILMIIDALRFDFVHQMPSTWKFINENHTDACLVRLKVHPPTVTMPKIKTIISGTVPSFFDVILNLNNGQAMTGDNLCEFWIFISWVHSLNKTFVF